MKCEVRPEGRGVFYPGKVTGYGRCHNNRLTEVDVRIDDGYQVAAGAEYVTIDTAVRNKDGTYTAIGENVRVRRSYNVHFK